MAQKVRRDIVQQELVAASGGCCARCRKSFHPGCYDFHHIDPTVKEFNLDRSSFGRNIGRLIKEAGKCVLLCCLCHREVHLFRDKRFLVDKSHPVEITSLFDDIIPTLSVGDLIEERSTEK